MELEQCVGPPSGHMEGSVCVHQPVTAALLSCGRSSEMDPLPLVTYVKT